MENIKNLFSNNIAGIIGIIFICGTLYAKISFIQDHQKTLEARLDKKIKVINDLNERLIEAEKEIAILKNCGK